jgi:hypothetical protein
MNLLTYCEVIYLTQVTNSSKFFKPSLKSKFNMQELSGYAELFITKINGEKESVVIDGNQFSQEQGGFSCDRDDGELSGGFIYIAFCEGFDLILNINIHGNSITYYDLKVRENDLEEFEIKNVKIIEDDLDASNLFPSLDNEFDDDE